MTRRYLDPEQALCVSVEQCADMLGLSRATVYTLIETANLPVVHFGAKAVRVPVAQLKAWLNARIAAEQQQREEQAQRLTPVKIQPSPSPAARNGTRRIR